MTEALIIMMQVVTALLAAQWLFARWNAARIPRLGNDDKKPSVTTERSDVRLRLSVLIPARNEADHISACLQSVLQSVRHWESETGHSGEAGGIEILVMDDRSEDGTGKLAAEAGQGRVRVLQGTEPPPGSLGKPHACARLAEEARGEWLLFLDADIRLRPGALAAALRSAPSQGRGLITGFARQETGSWLEALVVPLMLFTIVCHLPVPLVRGSRDPRFAAAHGGFMLISRESYTRCGGHAAIAGEIVDDMALARAVKAAGDPLQLADINAAASMRMYRSAPEVWNGYRKNIYAGLGRSTPALFGVLFFYQLLYVFPVFVLLVSALLGSGQLAIWAGAALLLGAAVKRTADRAGGQPRRYCLLLPAAIPALTAIALASWYGAKSGKGYEWKGRRYS